MKISHLFLYAVLLILSACKSDVAVTKVYLNYSIFTLTVGATLELEAIIMPENATNKNVYWISDNSAVATVSNGTVAGLTSGNAVVTVTTQDGNKTAECSVTVKEKEVVEKPKPKPEMLRDGPFPVGAALNPASLRTDVQYCELVLKELTGITPENAMKMPNLTNGARGVYDWTDADYFADFAQSNGIRLHGHCLVWYKDGTRTDAKMKWFVNFSGSKEEWKQMMREYILAVVGRYKGKVVAWDVVNEALMDDGSFRGDGDIWCKNIGAPDYIDWAFLCAHEADPDALLFYNDYGHEYSATKRTAINNLIKGMIARGVPIHGIGLQFHTNTDRNTADLKTAILTAAQTGLKVHVSELTVDVNASKDANAELEKQYESYKMVSATMSSLPKEQQYGITTWGLRDPVSPPPGPLMFDNNYQRKRAYAGVVDGFPR